MKLHEMFPSKYIRAVDLDGAPMVVTIDRMEQQNVSREDPNELKPVLYFRDEDRGLVLNVTNGNTIGDLYGLDSDDWCGREIELFHARVPFGNKTVDAIRVRPPQRVIPREAIEGTAAEPKLA